MLVVPGAVVRVAAGIVASELLEPFEPPAERAVGQGRSLNELRASKLFAPVTVTTAVAVHPPSIVVCGRTARLTTFLPLVRASELRKDQLRKRRDTRSWSG